MLKTKYTTEELECNVMYFKEYDYTLATINVEHGWKMSGVINDLARFPFWELIHPENGYTLDQDDCEALIRHRIRPYRGELLYDEIELLGDRRGENTLDFYWFAWSLEDKAKDWHPKYNKELMDKFHPPLEVVGERIRENRKREQAERERLIRERQINI